MEPHIPLLSIPNQLFPPSYQVMSTYIDSKSEGNASVRVKQYTPRILKVCLLFALKLRDMAMYGYLFQEGEET